LISVDGNTVSILVCEGNVLSLKSTGNKDEVKSEPDGLPFTSANCNPTCAWIISFAAGFKNSI
jgi:hypothetical protein